MGRLLTVLVAATLASSAHAIHPAAAFQTVLPKVKRQTAVAILLPETLPTAGADPKLYAGGSGTANSWRLELDGAPSCHGADACFVAGFGAKRSGRLPSGVGITKLTLSNGDPARYHPITCGASCAPASLWFTHHGVLYSWQLKDAPKDARMAMAAAAASAIAAGAR
jgi:hypothetical protein